MLFHLAGPGLIRVFFLEVSNSGIISKSIVSIEPEKSEVYFIKPHGFRPNSLFVGRTEELAEIHRLLFNEKRRSEGTSTVLIQSLPGGGKSHLARQYVYDHLKDFPGGIFWVRAKSQEQLSLGFWEIARQVALKSIAGGGSDKPPKDLTEFISLVIDWLNEHDDWLLVLDGMHFDHTNDVRRFIPDHPNTSLIYTSTEKSVGGDHHFMNPQVIILPLLSAREAQTLFLLELDIKKPSTDELMITMELVQRMGFLPLVIHAAAQRVKATGEPLAKFARHFASGPKLRELETYKYTVDQLAAAGSVEALNLMNTICFFSQHIPVEMMNLGLKAVDVPTKAYEAISGRSLNNTFKILNRFALIERTEGTDLSTSQGTRGSQELTDHVDMVKIHSVVQDFFVDSLKADKTLPTWLQRAVAMFLKSYDTANSRINSKIQTGLVGDYRNYEIHGMRIMEHLAKNERKYSVLTESAHKMEECMVDIRSEILRRTRESSVDLVHGRADPLQTSIFDRTSSSSDTGPETPGPYTSQFAWGTEDKERQTESPTSIRGDAFYHQKSVPDVDPRHLPLPPMPAAEDPGYDSDHDETMTGMFCSEFTSCEQGTPFCVP